MDEDTTRAHVEPLEKEIKRLEGLIAGTADAGEKRLLKRRLKKAQRLRLQLLGKLG